jgi:hypothetical protein
MKVCLAGQSERTSNNGHYRLAVWGNNMLDEKVIVQTGSQTLNGYSTAYGSAPRTHGVTGNVYF